jgi:hypothetical protein
MIENVVVDLTDSPISFIGNKHKKRVEEEDLGNYDHEFSDDQEYLPYSSEEFVNQKGKLFNVDDDDDDDDDDQKVIDVGSTSSDDDGNSDYDYESDPIDNESWGNEEVPLNCDEMFTSTNDNIPPVTFPAVSEHFW